jgi:hypothetical protein
MGGSLALLCEQVGATSTLNVLKCVVLVTASVTITLPDATGVTGRIYYIKSIGSGITVTIAPPAGTTPAQTIDGSTANRTITTQYKGLEVISDGLNWYIISEFDGTF